MIRSWGFRTKVLAGYGLVLLLIVFVLGWAIHNLLRLGQASDAILSENYRSILAAENMIDALERQDSGVLLFILGFESEGTSQFQENERRFLQWVARARDNITIGGEEEIVARIDSAYGEYLRTFTTFMQTSAATGRRQALHYHDALLPAFLAVRQASVDLRDLNQHTMYEASETAGAVSHAAILSMTAVGVLALVLALVFSLVLSNRIVRPVQRLREAASSIAEGHYDVEVPSGTSDELGRLADQFNEMATRLKAYHDLNVGQLMAEKRKSEAIVRSIDDGIIAVDAHLTIMDINPVAAQVLGISATEDVGRKFQQVVGGGRLLEYVKKSLSTGESPRIEENEAFLTLRDEQGETHYQYLVTPVRTPSGTMLGAILLLRNVTRLRELDRLKSAFVAMASHELQTPLTSIGMSIGLLSERVAAHLDDSERELLEVAGEEVNRLRSLVRDLLDLSKIEAGKVKMTFDVVPVRLLAEKAVDALRTQAEDREVELLTSIDETLPRARADANKITWVLTNLISNALRYTQADGHVRVSAREEGGTIHMAVADDGAGIPYKFQSRIFEKFVQIDDHEGKGGSGLGLAICKEIVRAHGGSIWVDSKPGAGSTFTFTLPVA